MYRSLLDMIRCMLKNGSLEKRFWGEDFLHAVYLRNITSINKESVITHEEFNGTKPDVSHLRVIGCNVFIYRKDSSKKKLENRKSHLIHIRIEDQEYLRRLTRKIIDFST